MWGFDEFRKHLCDALAKGFVAIDGGSDQIQLSRVVERSGAFPGPQPEPAPGF